MPPRFFLTLAITAGISGYAFHAGAQMPDYAGAPPCDIGTCRPHMEALTSARMRLDAARAAQLSQQARLDQMAAQRSQALARVDARTAECNAWRASRPYDPAKTPDDRGTDCENRRAQAATDLNRIDADIDQLRQQIRNLDMEISVAVQGMTTTETAHRDCQRICLGAPQ